MASFRHHISFGAVVAIVACTFAHYLAYVTDLHLLGILFAVSVGASFLPDLDSDSGLPFYFVFGFFTLLVGGIVLYLTLLSGTTSYKVLVGAPLAALAFMWFVVGGILKRLTNHRGMMHSIPAALIAGVATYLIATTSAQGDYRSFMLSIAVSMGYVSHLVLDELHAGINLGGRLFRPRRSLGSALKFVSSSRMSTVLTYVTLCTLLVIASN